MQNLAAKTFCGGEGERVAATDAAGTVPSCCERTSNHMQYKAFSHGQHASAWCHGATVHRANMQQ